MVIGHSNDEDNDAVEAHRSRNKVTWADVVASGHQKEKETPRRNEQRNKFLPLTSVNVWACDASSFFYFNSFVY